MHLSSFLPAACFPHSQTLSEVNGIGAKSSFQPFTLQDGGLMKMFHGPRPICRLAIEKYWHRTRGGRLRIHPIRHQERRTSTLRAVNPRTFQGDTSGARQKTPTEAFNLDCHHMSSQGNLDSARPLATFRRNQSQHEVKDCHQSTSLLVRRIALEL